jgi:hypothetical protein
LEQLAQAFFSVVSDAVQEGNILLSAVNISMEQVIVQRHSLMARTYVMLCPVSQIEIAFDACITAIAEFKAERSSPLQPPGSLTSAASIVNFEASLVKDSTSSAVMSKSRPYHSKHRAEQPSPDCPPPKRQRSTKVDSPPIQTCASQRAFGDALEPLQEVSEADDRMGAVFHRIHRHLECLRRYNRAGRYREAQEEVMAILAEATSAGCRRLAAQASRLAVVTGYLPEKVLSELEVHLDAAQALWKSGRYVA